MVFVWLLFGYCILEFQPGAIRTVPLESLEPENHSSFNEGILQTPNSWQGLR
jgi:hypothetical protein